MASKDVVTDKADLSKVSECTSSKINERGERAKETSSQIKAHKSMAMEHKGTLTKDAVPAEGVADNDGKATPSKSALAKQKETPVKKAIVDTLHHQNMLSLL